MERELSKIFGKTRHQPEPGLTSLTWERIVKREKRLTRNRLYFFSLLGVFSLAGAVPVFKILLGELAQSGFYDYLSVASSGQGILIAYWRELALSLSESLPAMNLAYSAILVFVFFLSLRFAIKQITKGQLITLRVNPA